MRKEYKDQLTAGKYPASCRFAKACAAALQEIPATVTDDEANETVYRDYVDISGRGLLHALTSAVRNVEQMSMLDIESTVAMFGEKARNDQIALEDMAGGTFIISNGASWLCDGHAHHQLAAVCCTGHARSRSHGRGR